MSNLRIPVLIVDDEYLIRSLVRNSVDWEENGFEIVGEAEDGETALAMVAQLHPLLMVVDINIPFINGLELTKQIRVKYPLIKIIILTGYEDFTYARTAIQAGVLNYILKPIDPEEFNETIIAAREKILIDERHRLLSVQNQIRRKPDMQSLKARFLSTLLSGGYGDDEHAVLDRWNLFRVAVHPENLVVAVIDAPVPEHCGAGLNLQGAELFSDGQGRMALLTNDDTSTRRVKDKVYYELSGRLLRRCAADYGSLSLGISSVVQTIAALPEAYRQALAACRASYHEGRNKIHLFEDLHEQRDEGLTLPSFPDREKLLLYLRSGQRSRATELVRSYVNNISAKKLPREYCEAACMDMITVVNEFLEENGSNLIPHLQGAEDVFSLFQRFSTFKDLNQWIEHVISALFEAKETGKVSRTQLVVRKAKLYIEKNYVKKFVTLERIAESVSVSPSYLSSIFKKELGVSVVEYITDFRLKAAKGIMDGEPLLPVMQVAERVGYSDPYYFSKCFRKHFGVSPSSYLRGKKIIS